MTLASMIALTAAPSVVFAGGYQWTNDTETIHGDVMVIALDEESGKEKKSNSYMLVQANDVKEAFENTEKAMEETMGDYTIPAIAESPILDVFPYFTGEEEQLEKFNMMDAVETINEEASSEEE